jgi:hypothetical protein
MHVVPEYDAFGREIGDDPLAPFRRGNESPIPSDESGTAERPSGDGPQRPAVDDASAASDGPAPGHAPPAPEFVHGRSVTVRVRPRGVVALAFVAVAIGALGISAVALVNVASEGIDSLTPPATPAFQSPDEAGPRGLESGSLIRPDEFERAIAGLRETGLGRPDSLRLAPARIDASLDDGRTRTSVQLRFDDSLREFSSTASGGNRAAIPWNRIDPAAPRRLVRAAARRTRLPLRRIDYLVLTGNPLTWGAYFRGGAIVQGDAHGRVTRVL